MYIRIWVNTINYTKILMSIKPHRCAYKYLFQNITGILIYIYFLCYCCVLEIQFMFIIYIFFASITILISFNNNNFIILLHKILICFLTLHRQQYNLYNSIEQIRLWCTCFNVFCFLFFYYILYFTIYLPMYIML